MFKHNLKMSFRNLWKYKTQTIISIIGLAIGFTCFSLATLWIRYEMTYDNFHKNAEQLYLPVFPSSFSGASFNVPGPLPAYLKETFPEVKEAVYMWETKVQLEVDGVPIDCNAMATYASFMRIFDIKVLEGRLDFIDSELAITQRKAKMLFGNESPIGKVLTSYGTEYTITAVVSSYSNHSNFPFDIITVAQYDERWNRTRNSVCMLELYPNINVEAFKQKLQEHKITQSGEEYGTIRIGGISLLALTDLRTEDPTRIRDIKFAHIKLFALMGILVILCSLFNYLTLFVSRFKIRGKELALRVVCGASLWSLFSLLLAEFLTTLLAAMLLGLLIMNIVSPTFQTMSEIQMNMGNIYAEMILYISAIILLTVLLFAFTLFVFRKYALNASIRRSNNKLFRKVSIVSQLIISIGFVFCTVVMIKQIRYLHNSSNIGFEYKNRSSMPFANAVIGDKLKQIPEITDVVTEHSPLMPVLSRANYLISTWDDQTEEQKKVGLNMEQVFISDEFSKFYGFQLIAGEMITEGQSDDLLINESAMRNFGWHIDNAVGKRCNFGVIKGVIKNVYNLSPTVEVPPTFYEYSKQERGGILFKYTNRKIAEAKIKELMEKEFPDEPEAYIADAEEAYERFFKSENALITMLNIMSAICVLISVFGFFSLVSLSCEEKRKEIAIRKVNGADIHDIIAIFFKEYSLLLVIGAAIAFPIGYYIMKNWIEQYINQTSIDAWIYAAILLVIATVIILCVGWRVYKTSRENPADVVKSE